MNIKSLLLGSAAALVAVSGARAADAVVIAEPEPMEYVRVCDTYGVGFFYIPGTETCLRVSGRIRYDIDFEEDDNGWRKRTQAVVNFDARSETEYGTFRRFIRLEGNAYNNDYRNFGSQYYDDTGPGNNVKLAYGYIELGGLLVGYYDTLFDADLQVEFDQTGDYDTVNQIRYTFNGGNGVNAALSLETYNYNETYTPNVVGNIGITQGWGGIQLWAAYDAGNDDLYFFPAYDDFYNEDSWSVKAIGTWKATDALTIDAEVQYSSDSNGASIYSSGYEWLVGASMIYQATDKLSFGIGAQGFFNANGADLINIGNGEFQVIEQDGDGWNVGGQVQYNIVENLLARLWVRYNSFDDDLDYTDEDNYFDGKFRLEATF